MKKLKNLLVLLIVFCNVDVLANDKNRILEKLDVATAQQMMADGRLSSRDLVKWYIKRIDKFDRHLNSVITLNPHAKKIAKERDKERAAGKLRGPLHGIPVLLKDNIDTGDGMANTAGSLVLKDNRPANDAPLVRRLRDAGAVILGKANLSEWANFRSIASSSGWSAMGGQARNPYDPTRSPCGSSAGSAVAVAASFSLLAIGTETDGSITCPAAMSGVVGIKPSLGLVSQQGIIPIAHSQDTAGPMATSVSDAVHTLDAIAEPDYRRQALGSDDARYADFLKGGGLKGKRIGIAADLMSKNAATNAVFMQNIDVLREAGAEVIEDIKMESNDAWREAEWQILLWEFKSGVADYLQHSNLEHLKTLDDLIKANNSLAEKELEHFGQEIFEMANNSKGIREEQYQAQVALAKRTAGAEGIDKVLQEHKLDMLIAPTTSPAWKIDYVLGDNYQGSASSPAAVSGYPHITVPMGFVKHMPVGLSFFGANNSEGELIQAAFDYEARSLARVPPDLRKVVK